MPEAYDCVIIDTTFIAPETPVDNSGETLIISPGSEGAESKLSYYDTLEELLEDYSETEYPAIAKAAKCMDKNGATKMGVGIFDGTKTIAELYELMEYDAKIHKFTSVIYAGLEIDGTTISKIEPTGKDSLVKFCDDNQIVFIAALTPPRTGNNVTVDTMIGLRAHFNSPNVYVVCHNDPTASDDIGACVAGRMESLEPQITLMWKTVYCDVANYFTNRDVNKLEAVHYNCLLLDYGLSESFTGNYYVSGTNDEDSIIKDISITRSIYYLKRAIQKAIINLRKKTNKLGYTNHSLNMIAATISTVLEQEKESALNTEGMIDSYTLTMPLLTDITAYEKSINVLRNVVISVVLTGEIHTFHFSLVVSLGAN